MSFLGCHLKLRVSIFEIFFHMLIKWNSIILFFAFELLRKSDSQTQPSCLKLENFENNQGIPEVPC